MNPAEKRYCIVGDDSGHEYYIPDNRKDAWYSWLESELAENGEVPEYASRIDGRFTFTDPRCE